MYEAIIDKILEFIDERIESCHRIDIDMLTKYSGYSRRHLQRLFLIKTGVNIGEYIRKRRLNRAALLIRFSLRSFKNIALSLGFNCQQAFNREFKELTGFTPGEYRSYPEWILFPLSGSKLQSEYNLSNSEIVYLDNEIWINDEVEFFGSIGYKQKNDSFNEYLKIIFNTDVYNNGELWVVPKINLLKENKYNYQVICSLGDVNKNAGMNSFYFSGKYLKYEFETTIESHMELVNYLYMNVLPRNNVIKRFGSEILIFKYYNNRVLCKIHIPIM